MEFNEDYLDQFLGIVRKYMQMRGQLSQKDLAEMTEVGVSTMSRFLNQKTNELNSQLIAKIVAKLDIPLHEMIDFVSEEFTDKFVRLVKFYKEEMHGARRKSRDSGMVAGERESDEFAETFESLGTAKRGTKAKVSVGGKRNTIHFEADEKAKNSAKSLREKLEGLSPRQKAYMTDFLNLDAESRDLIVDLGNALFRYFRQKGLE